LPKGAWYDYWTNRKYDGGTMIAVDAPLETVPMFVRAGSIIPMGPEMNYVGEKPMDPITFNVYPDEKGAAAVTLYEDDGVSPAYKQDGFRRTNISVSRVAGVYTASIGAPTGNYNPAPRKFSFVIKAGAAARPTTIVPDSGAARTVTIR
jgi:alpha-glucosidase (family GH31 glycosyl hydrolase)